LSCTCCLAELSINQLFGEKSGAWFHTRPFLCQTPLGSFLQKAIKAIEGVQEAQALIDTVGGEEVAHALVETFGKKDDAKLKIG
jgi:hypothetical protein